MDCIGYAIRLFGMIIPQFVRNGKQLSFGRTGLTISNSMAGIWNILLLCLYLAALVIAPAVHRLEGHGGNACSACTCGWNEKKEGYPASFPTCGPNEKQGEDHRASHSHSAPHDAEHCPICQLAHTPFLASAPLIVLMPETASVRLPAAMFSEPAVPVVRLLPFPRGPPA